jgi:hypothetical protein
MKWLEKIGTQLKKIVDFNYFKLLQWGLNLKLSFMFDLM